MGETQTQPFQLSFNAALKVEFQGSRVTSDGGLILVRELDERLGFSDLIAQHLTDPRGKNTQFPLADLVRQSVYSRLADYEDVNDAERLSQDPTFRLIGSEKNGKKSFNSPDETTKPERAKVEVVLAGDLTFQRVTVEPGWQWSKHLKPVVKTESCEKHHVIYLISGRLHVRMNDGKEEEFGPGDVGVVPPGHDAWVVGNETVI